MKTHERSFIENFPITSHLLKQLVCAVFDLYIRTTLIGQVKAEDRYNEKKITIISKIEFE